MIDTVLGSAASENGFMQLNTSAVVQSHLLTNFVNWTNERNALLNDTISQVANCGQSVYQEQLDADYTFINSILAGASPPVSYACYR